MNEIQLEINPVPGECPKYYIAQIIEGAARAAAVDRTCQPGASQESKIKVTVSASYPPLKLTASISW